MISDEHRGSGYPSSVPAPSSFGPCRHVMYSYGSRFMPSRVAVTTAQSAADMSAMRSASDVARCTSSTTFPPTASSPLPPELSVTPYVALSRSTVASTSACSSDISLPPLRAGLHTCTRHIFSASSGCCESRSSNACSLSSIPLKMSMSSTPRNTFLPRNAPRYLARASRASGHSTPSRSRSVFTPVGQIFTPTARP